MRCLVDLVSHFHLLDQQLLSLRLAKQVSTRMLKRSTPPLSVAADDGSSRKKLIVCRCLLREAPAGPTLRAAPACRVRTGCAPSAAAAAAAVGSAPRPRSWRRPRRTGGRSALAPAPSRMDGRQFLAIGAALTKPPVSATGMGVGSARRRLLVRAEQQELDCRLDDWIGLDWTGLVR